MVKWIEGVCIWPIVVANVEGLVESELLLLVAAGLS
jgi:hypothetical protein